MARLPLTLACGDYEILRPLKEGLVTAEGIDLNIITGMDSTTRHWRFLRNEEFDIAEVSCSSYLVARDQGSAIDGLPVFPHRRFRHGFAFVNVSKAIQEPADLRGRKIGLKQYQSTAVVWLRGILKHEYGVPLETIQWLCELDETFEFPGARNIKITRLPHDRSVEQMLVDGEIDALLHPDLIKPLVNKDRRVARLFPNYRAEELAFYKKTAIFPIMHAVAIKRSVVKEHPWVPINLFNAFDAAKNIAMKRLANPRMVPLVWYREAWEEQEDVFGDDPWEYGLSKKNEHTLTTLVDYAYEQSLLQRKPSLDELFLNVSQGRKRGVEFRF